MTIQFNCQFCGTPQKVDDSQGGEKIKCPTCNGTLTTPTLATSDIVEQPTRTIAVRKVACPACHELISAKDRVCPVCGESTKRSLKRKPRPLPFAEPRQRLLGAIIDSCAAMLFMAPGVALFLANAPDGESASLSWWGILGAMLGELVCFTTQLYLVATRSQTIGKCFARMRVMDYETDQPAGPMKAIVLRMFVNGCLSVVGNGAYSMLDTLFVFSKEHRCLHDLIAGTYVANISDT